MKRLRVLLLPPGWDASPSQGYPPAHPTHTPRLPPLDGMLVHRKVTPQPTPPTHPKVTPPDGMLVHRKVTPPAHPTHTPQGYPPGWDACPSQGYPQHYVVSTYLYTWVERDNVEQRFLSKETT